jgi:hypothetical protein
MRGYLGDPVVYNTDTGKYYPPSPQLRAKMSKSATHGLRIVPKQAKVLQMPPPAEPDASADPVGDFLERDFVAGIKMKYAIPAAAFALGILAMGGGKRRR